MRNLRPVQATEWVLRPVAAIQGRKGALVARAMRPLRDILVVLTVLGACGHKAAPSVAVPPEAIITFEEHLGLIFLNVSIGGSPVHPFLLDSGISPSAIDVDLARELGITVPAAKLESAPGGAIPISRAPSVTLTVDRIRFEARDMAVLPLRPLGRVVGRPIAGLIGNDFFERYVIEVDYALRQVTLYDPARYVYRGRGEVLRLDVADGEPFVHGVIVNGDKRSEAKLKVDTGSASSLGLNGSYVAKADLFPINQPRLTTFGAALGGRTRAFVTRASALLLGSIRIERPVAAYTEDLSRGGDAGTLGGGLLRRFTVVFDQAHRKLILEPKSGIATPEVYDMTGFTTTAVDDTLGELAIVAVAEKSPAAEAGLRVGDVITAIDDQKIQKVTLRGLWQRQREAGVLRLRVRRAGETSDITIRPRPLI